MITIRVNYTGKENLDDCFNDHQVNLTPVFATFEHAYFQPRCGLRFSHLENIISKLKDRNFDPKIQVTV